MGGSDDVRSDRSPLFGRCIGGFGGVPLLVSIHIYPGPQAGVTGPVGVDGEDSSACPIRQGLAVAGAGAGEVVGAETGGVT
ncbi:hypothetical protein, partial [Escherichia coli]|uniref:hypothetical protein n=1 Tax=Escherichia coli TaxID=562 RepID=UPI0012CC3733